LPTLFSRTGREVPLLETSRCGQVDHLAGR
jgi:hypothetical protein